MSLFLDHARSTELYRKLCAAVESADGNLLERTDDKTAEAQVEFLRWALAQARPAVIVETATNKGLFLYLVSLLCRDVTVHTFDRDPRCARAAELVNQSQCNVVAVFHEGDTRQALRDLNVEAQFAWIDGGHDADIPLSDLMQCYRLRIPYVAVDDSAYPELQQAVQYMTGQTPYRIAGNPFIEHDRRRAVLLHLPSEQRATASAIA